MNDFSLGEVVCGFQCGLVTSSYEGRISDYSVKVDMRETNQLKASTSKEINACSRAVHLAINTMDYYFFVFLRKSITNN